MSSSSGSDSSSSSSGWMTFRSTKYTADCTGCSGYTATGVNVNNTIYYNGMRIIAVDPGVIPLHSIVEVRTPSGSFRAVAKDTGGAIHGRKIDILVSSKSEAYNWGNRSVQVKIIRRGN
ncbi:3D domain-containing protein [Piscibacillus salipiscarius]|uniref:3D domain-containing protein n=1 Tax=Piscibacillus salipiscarius TaxID=299480 RepID=UPI0024373D89|nr:3D domain-containing protein [Piscibacillus salipiscarius]